MLLFTQAEAPQVGCEIGGGNGLGITPTSSVYADNNGMTCSATLRVDPHGIGRFLDQNRDGFFQAPMNRMALAFNFNSTESGHRFKVAIGDWGLTNQGEENECNLTMTGCANGGFFDFAKRTCPKVSIDFGFAPSRIGNAPIVARGSGSPKSSGFNCAAQRAEAKPVLELYNVSYSHVGHVTLLR